MLKGTNLFLCEQASHGPYLGSSNFLILLNQKPPTPMKADWVSVQTPIAQELAAVTQQLEALLQDQAVFTQEIRDYLLQHPGKQMRPTCVLLAAGACGNISPQAQRGAIMATLLHQVSIVHDDVVDNAAYRRGQPTLHTTCNNKIAVLLGDYLFAKGIRLAVQHQDYSLLDTITLSAQTMAQGELLQLACAHQFDISEETYLTIIRQKTAHLFGACFAIGAMTAQAPPELVANMQEVGEQLGMAFQLQDDWSDYSTENLGKPSGLDLREGNFTLPLIHALQQASPKERQHINQRSHDPQQHPAILAWVRHSPGMAYTQAAIVRYTQGALQGLQKLPNSPYQQSLYTLVQSMLPVNGRAVSPESSSPSA